VLIYPAFLTEGNAGEHLYRELQITQGTPPTLLLHASDDGAQAEGSLRYLGALKDHHLPAELHVFVDGGHGFGLARRDGSTVNAWLELAIRWFQNRGILPETPHTAWRDR